jgi:FkbM family methyltransferase
MLLKLLLKISLLIKYIRAFGFLLGMGNFLQTHLARGEASIRLPGLKQTIYLRRGTSDIAVFNQVFLVEEYKVSLKESPRFIVDCGANVGLTTVFFRLMYPEAFIVAVEPEASNFAMLERNTSKLDSIHCLRAGIWNRDTFLRVENASAEKWEFTFLETGNQPGAVKAISITSILQQFDRKEIDILKMDIEGSEQEVFSTNYESWLPKVKAILIELHDSIRKGCSSSLFRALLQYDFSFDVVGKGKTVICKRN